tara:strand:- start:840 stop:1502 length:663 start_codon:yes stop_codon:yes gene_type:complete
MRNILICGYRDWSYDIYKLLKAYDYNVTYVDDKDFLEIVIKEVQPKIIFFIGWSWIVEQDIIDNYPCICLHPSPLPKYRGGSPIQNQIMNGEKESAVTLFEMDEGLDTGDILYQESFSLDGDLKDIFKRIKDVGVNGICSILEGNIKTVKQNEEEATTYKRRTKDMSEIKIDDIENYTAEELYDKVRSLQYPYPNAYIKCKNGEKLFITKANLGENVETN